MKTLYVTDLDGTLLNASGQISPFSAKSINALLERGMLFTYASARSFSTAAQVTAPLRLTLPAIVYNGAFIVDTGSGETLFSAFLSEEQIARIRAFIKDAFAPLVYSYIGQNEHVSYLASAVSSGMQAYLDARRGDKRLRPVQTQEELFEGQPFYFTFIGDEVSLTPLYQRFADDVDLNVLLQQEKGQHFWCEIMPKAATKGNALKRLKNMVGAEKLVCFGDGLNDAALFHQADACYAVKNAVPALQKLATALIASNEEDGVARFLMAQHF